ncbi:hypothetical protein CKO28_00985 [Rhodovibrio sodomensis]|uniref:Uncharacterized protein n=1 Tax=Rhodovibrio sodomensis TaxID=1088 RepID=A0ABS1D916_9PROT|nr:hypothetical protein [Rhodovibrio sodomensis]MBK1666617.1 hypothetical protein [Rhodovibrio sodomensis]
MQDRLLDIEGRLKTALLETRMPFGYDRQGSHREGRYVAYQVGLGQNAGLLEQPELSGHLAEMLVEQVLASLSPADLEHLLARAAGNGGRIHAEAERVAHLGDDLADEFERPDEPPICWPTGRIDEIALCLAQHAYAAAGLPEPDSLEQVKASHWRREAMRHYAAEEYARRNREDAA